MTLHAVERAADALRQGARLGSVLNLAPARRRGGYGHGRGGGYGASTHDNTRARRVLTGDEVPAPEPRA